MVTEKEIKRKKQRKISERKKKKLQEERKKPKCKYCLEMNKVMNER